MCPGAEQLLGQLVQRGRVVCLAFHVDYFNDPWRDRFSRKQFTEREIAYGRVQKRDDLVFTPMLMVDGRVPMLGTDRSKARKALAAALADSPGVALELKLESESEAETPRRKSLGVLVGEPAENVVDRQLVVGVATFENRVTTKVKSGENAGKTLVEHCAVRSLDVKFVRLERGGQARISFKVELDRDCAPAGCGVAAFVQDEQTGRIYQAAAVPWTGTPARSEATSTTPRKRAR